MSNLNKNVKKNKHNTGNPSDTYKILKDEILEDDLRVAKSLDPLPSLSNLLNKNVKKNKQIHNTGKSNVASITIYMTPEFKAYIKKIALEVTGTSNMSSYLRQLFVTKHGLPGGSGLTGKE